MRQTQPVIPAQAGIQGFRRYDCDWVSVIECFETDGGVNVRFDRLI